MNDKAKNILLGIVPKNCYWEDMDNLTNTPIKYVIEAMEQYSSVEHNKLEAINKQLLEALQHAVDLFKELHPPDGVHDCKFYESLIAKSKL